MKTLTKSLEIGNKYIFVEQPGVFIYQGVAKRAGKMLKDTKLPWVEFSSDKKSIFNQKDNNDHRSSIVMTLEQARSGVQTGAIVEATADLEAKFLLLGGENERWLGIGRENKARNISSFQRRPLSC